MKLEGVLLLAALATASALGFLAIGPVGIILIPAEALLGSLIGLGLMTLLAAVFPAIR